MVQIFGVVPYEAWMSVGWLDRHQEAIRGVEAIHEMEAFGCTDTIGQVSCGVRGTRCRRQNFEYQDCYRPILNSIRVPRLYDVGMNKETQAEREPWMDL